MSDERSCERRCEREWSRCPRPCPCPKPCPPCPKPCPGPGTPGVGSYGPYAVPTAVQIELFQKAVDHLMGATYTPFIVATQIVSGTNYLFIAQKEVPTASGTIYTLVAVKIYEAADGTVRLISIDPIIIK